MVVATAAFRRWWCVCLVVAGAAAQLSCGRSPSGPTPTSSTGGATSSLTIARGAPAPTVPTVVRVAAGDFGRCLQDAGTPACFDAAGLGRATAVAGLTAPGAPGSLVATSTGSSVTLTWTAPTSGDPVLAYTIEAGSSSGAANLASFSTGNSATTFSATGVGSGSYYVRVRATNTAGTSAPSNEALLVVGCSLPGAPSGLREVSNSGGTVVLSWTAASGSPTSYIVQAGSTFGAANLANSDLGSAATTLTATGVGPGQYYVRVRAKNACGTGNPSNELLLGVARIVPPTITVISPVRGLTGGGQLVTLQGDGFLSRATVTFGGTAATRVDVNSSSYINATTPAHAAGTVDVVVTNSTGQSVTRTGGYTYVVVFPDNNGIWRGQTPQGASIYIVVQNNQVTRFEYSSGGCTANFQVFLGAGLSIINGEFSYSSSSLTFNGTVLSTSNMQGTVQACGVSRSWTATHDS
jgi:hypothetical protein